MRVFTIGSAVVDPGISKVAVLSIDRYAGIGEKLDDLVVFDPELYVNGLFE